MKRTILIVLAIAVCAALLYWFMQRSSVDMPALVSVSTFEECVAAGNPIMESMPRQCRTQAGAVFVEDVPPPAPATPGVPDDGDPRVGDSNGLDGTGETVEAQGTLTAISLEEMMVDGPARLTLTTVDGSTRTVLIPSMGLPLCEARASIADVATLSVGDTLEVRGDTDSEGSITPCTAADHYLRTSAQQ